MTDFVERVLRPEQHDWIIRSLLDNDFYKFTMGAFIHRYHRGVNVAFELINRDLSLPLADIIDEGELRAQLDHVMTLRLRPTDIYYLRGMDVYGQTMFAPEYLQFLAGLQLPSYTLTRVGSQYKLRFQAAWEESTWWECIAITIIVELLYRTLMRSMSRSELEVMFGRAIDKLYKKLKRITERPWLRIGDFGYRRRFGHLWHKRVLEMCREILGEQFTGASSTWMAFNQDLTPIGTNAHELPMVLTALADTDEEKRAAQYEVLRKWGPLHPDNALRIALPDTYGSKQFWAGMPGDLAEEVAHNWRGVRLDSGDPIEEAVNFIRWLEGHGVDSWKDNKIVIPSDGLDIDSIFEIDDALEGKIRHPYGWGTNLTNDFRGCHPRGNEFAVVNGTQLALTYDQLFRGHSIVCKTVEANGRPCVKLSNNVNKATGPIDEINRYLRIFGHEGRVKQEVLV